MFRQSTIPRVLTAPYTRSIDNKYYPSTLAKLLLFISDNKYYPKSLHVQCPVLVLFFSSTIPRVLIAPFSRKALKFIYYPSALSQWLVFISDNKYPPKSLHVLCPVRVLFFRVLFLEYL
jgi:hypothetical protein